MSADTDAQEEARSRIAELRRRGEDAIRGGVDTIRSSTRDLTDRARSGLDTSRHYVTDTVSERPLTIALGALAAGVLIGLLLSSARDR